MKKNLCLKKTGLLIVIAATVLVTQHSSAQTVSTTTRTDSTSVQIVTLEKPKTTYPKTVGYLSFILPLETLQGGKTTGNFGSTTSIGFPIGINVLYSDHFGFSYEFTPTIKSSNSSSKTSNLLFDPGTMFRFDHGFTIITRLAFETEGRYGFTPVFNQVYARTKDVNYFVALSLPNRFGDNEAYSIGLNLQLGLIFN
jgi:hypothetical protein